MYTKVRDSFCSEMESKMFSSTTVLIYGVIILAFTSISWGLDPYTAIQGKTGASMDAEVGTTKEIRCDVNSRPDGVSVRWERESYDKKICDKQTPPCRITLTVDRLPQDQQKYSLKFIPSDTYILIIKNIDETDEGTYICQLPLTRIVKVYDEVFLRVTQAPVIDPMKTSSDKTAEAGQQVQLTCGAFGRPEPTIRWTRAGNGMMPGGGFVKIGETLTIPSMLPSFRGPYICTAENDNGEAHRTINIDMKFKPELHSSPSVVSQMVGYETRVFCHAEAKPKATVRWFINNDEITDATAGYKITTYDSAFKKVISKLTINSVKSSTFTDLIECVGSNAQGTTKLKIKFEEASSVQPIPGAVSSAPAYYITMTILSLCLALVFL